MTTFALCKMVIDNERYSSSEDFQFRLDVFFTAGRLTEGEYNELSDMLANK